MSDSYISTCVYTVCPGIADAKSAFRKHSTFCRIETFNEEHEDNL